MSSLFVDSTAVRQFPEFRRLWLGLSLSQIGAQLGVVAIAYQVYRITGSVFDVGLVSLIQLGPTLLAAVVGGALADTMNRRTILIATELTIALCAVGLALNSSRQGLAGIAVPPRCSQRGRYRDRRPDTYSRDADHRGSTHVRLREFAPPAHQRLATVARPALGGVLLGTFSVTAVYWVNTASFLTALATVVSVKPRPAGDIPARFGVRSIVEGFAHFKGRQALQGCFVADLNAMILGMPSALFPAIGITELHGGARRSRPPVHGSRYWSRHCSVVALRMEQERSATGLRHLCSHHRLGRGDRCVWTQQNAATCSGLSCDRGNG